MGGRPILSQEGRILLRIAFNINVAKEGVTEAIAIESRTGLNSTAMEHLRVACSSLDNAISHLKSLRRDHISQGD
jgi:hypothetical protein